MFLPISDAPNPRGVPFVTWALIALNILVFLFINVPQGSQPADVSDPSYQEYVRFLSQYVNNQQDLELAKHRISAFDLSVFKHGFRPAHPSALDLLTSMFMHGGLMHLLGNMLFLWIYGDNVEHRLGRLWFVVWYLVTGAAATMFHALFFSTSEVPLVGASGAISGVLGFYFTWFPKNAVRVLLFLPPFFLQVIPISARIVLGIYLIIDNVVLFFLAGEGGVAHGAHIGGFLAGAAVALLVNLKSMATRSRDIEKPRKVPPGVESIRAALDRGEPDEAAASYLALPAGATRGVLSPDEAVSLALELRDRGRANAALVLLQRVIKDTPHAAGIGEAYALAGIILCDDLRDETAGFQYLVESLQAGVNRGTAAAVRRRLESIESRQKMHLGRWRRS